MSLLYLISSLPTLEMNSEPPLSEAEFMAVCEKWLSEKQCAIVRALLENKAHDHPFVKAWRNKETLLRNSIAKLRARATNQNPEPYTRRAVGCDLKLEADAEDALQHRNPLHKESDIKKIRWKILEELQGTDPLSINTIFAYAVKLAIVTRWSELDRETGRESFEKLTEIPITL